MARLRAELAELTSVEVHNVETGTTEREPRKLEEAKAAAKRRREGSKAAVQAVAELCGDVKRIKKENIEKTATATAAAAVAAAATAAAEAAEKGKAAAETVAAAAEKGKAAAGEDAEDAQDEHQYMITFSGKQADAIDRLKALAREHGADESKIKAAAAPQ